MMLLTLPGASFLYYGDEIGMTDVDIALEDVRDPVGKRRWPQPGRDPMRTPMQWSAEAGAGFTTAGVAPWLPSGDHTSVNVANQRDDPESILNLTRDLLRLRRSSPELRYGSYRARRAADGVWSWERGTGIVVVLNLGTTSVRPEVEGRVIVGTDRGMDGAPSASIDLAPSEGLVVQSAGARVGPG